MASESDFVWTRYSAWLRNRGEENSVMWNILPEAEPGAVMVDVSREFVLWLFIPPKQLYACLMADFSEVLVV